MASQFFYKHPECQFKSLCRKISIKLPWLRCSPCPVSTGYGVSRLPHQQGCARRLSEKRTRCPGNNTTGTIACSVSFRDRLQIFLTLRSNLHVLYVGFACSYLSQTNKQKNVTKYLNVIAKIKSLVVRFPLLLQKLISKHNFLNLFF